MQMKKWVVYKTLALKTHNTIYAHISESTDYIHYSSVPQIFDHTATKRSLDNRYRKYPGIRGQLKDFELIKMRVYVEQKRASNRNNNGE